MKNISPLVEVTFTTEDCQFLRNAVDSKDLPHRSTIPYSRIIQIEHERGAVRLPHPDPHAITTSSSKTKKYKVTITPYMLCRLLDYVTSRFTGVAPQQGNCHDFTCYMAGYDDLNMDEATDLINKLLGTAEPMDVTTLSPGAVMAVAHPDFRMYPLIDGQPPAAYNLHGPLGIYHSYIVLDDNPQHPLALHRMALNGALGITTATAAVLNDYKVRIPRTPATIWEKLQPPSSEDIDIYHIPGLDASIPRNHAYMAS